MLTRKRKFEETKQFQELRDQKEHVEAPKITQWPDIDKNMERILAFVKRYPERDLIFEIDCENDILAKEKQKEKIARPSISCVAGSKVLVELITFGNVNVADSVKVHRFKDADADVFILNSPTPKHRYRSIGGVDLVEVEAKTVDELLLGFDLPCCRVATDADEK